MISAIHSNYPYCGLLMKNISYEACLPMPVMCLIFGMCMYVCIQVLVYLYLNEYIPRHIFMCVYICVSPYMYTDTHIYLKVYI